MRFCGVVILGETDEMMKINPSPAMWRFLSSFGYPPNDWPKIVWISPRCFQTLHFTRKMSMVSWLWALKSIASRSSCEESWEFPRSTVLRRLAPWSNVSHAKGDWPNLESLEQIQGLLETSWPQQHVGITSYPSLGPSTIVQFRQSFGIPSFRCSTERTELVHTKLNT